MGVYTIHVVGESFENRQDEIELCEAGEPVVLKREPDNPYDDLAIKVLSSTGSALGYIGRENNEFLARIIDEGGNISAKIEQIIGAEGSKADLGVVLEVCTGSDAAQNELEYARTASVDEPDPGENSGLTTLVLLAIGAWFLWLIF